jgi:N utilization substance protein A
VRDAEQEKIYVQFAPRVGEIVTGTVRRVEEGNIILELNKTEAFFPAREKLPSDEFIRGATVKALITQVQKTTKGPQVFVSRSHPKFLAKLLELEIPEIANGNIEIKDLVRQPGERAKVSVLSREKDIDPVGACIGVKGNRILSISKELQGEKIDIIEWSPHALVYAKAALSPARIEKIILLDKQEKIMQAIVPRDQLSLAIGKKGINVKLASRLVGWKIEIKQE